MMALGFFAAARARTTTEKHVAVRCTTALSVAASRAGTRPMMGPRCTLSGRNFTAPCHRAHTRWRTGCALLVTMLSKRSCPPDISINRAEHADPNDNALPIETHADPL